MSDVFGSPPSDEVSGAPVGRRIGKETPARSLGAYSGRRELAHRSDNGVEVTLFWRPAADELRVCVSDERRGTYFEIRPEHYLALDVYYHPYAYLDFADVHQEEDRPAA